MKKPLFKVDVKKIVHDLSIKISAEVAAGKPKYKVYEEIGISHTTYNTLKNRPASWMIRTDVLCLICSWLGTEPGVYFIRS